MPKKFKFHVLERYEVIPKAILKEKCHSKTGPILKDYNTMVTGKLSKHVYLWTNNFTVRTVELEKGYLQMS